MQLDSYAALLGVRLERPQVVAALTQSTGSAYGIHPLTDATGPADEAPGNYVSVCAAPMVRGSKTIGTVVLVSSVQELMISLGGVQRQMLTAFAAVAAVAMIAALIFSRVLTGPIGTPHQNHPAYGQGRSVRPRAGEGLRRNACLGAGL